MKYPYVIFFRFDKYAEVDKVFVDNDSQLSCTVYITSNTEHLNKLFNPSYQILVTYGPNGMEYNSIINQYITNRFRSRWIHLTEVTDVKQFSSSVNYCCIHNCVKPREEVRPVFSVFSSTYNSYHKIIRAYESLKAQTLKDWEWVVIDDSPDDNHFQYLRELMLHDHRVRLFRKGENSGNIGHVKNEAISLCRGKYILEFDHDDEILPFVLQESADLFDKDEEVGFIYMDCLLIYENGNSYHFGDFICKGYGGYYCTKYKNKWAYIYITPNINNITLSHLVCCPNHPRIWRREHLIRAGSYSEFLPICDDYEIIIRTALTTKMAKIHKLGYVQYMNESNNNFSLIRNAEINRIGPQFISPISYHFLKVHDKMKELNAYEDEHYIHNASKIWERDLDTYEHKYCNLVLNPSYDKQVCIIGYESLEANIERILELYDNERVDFILLENKIPTEQLCSTIDQHGLFRFKCYSLKDCSQKNLVQFFKLLYKFCDDYEIFQPVEQPVEQQQEQKEDEVQID